MATDNKEKISKLDEKIKQLQAQKNKILAREKEKERKARTHRLIQVGATLERLNIKSLENALTIVNLYEKNATFKNMIDNALTNQNNTTGSENIPHSEPVTKHSFVDDEPVIKRSLADD